MKIKDITAYRTNQICYLIKDTADDFFVVYGSYFRKIDDGELYTIVTTFVEGKKDWSRVSELIRRNLQEDSKDKEHWTRHLEIKETEIDVVELYVDGEKVKLEN